MVQRMLDRVRLPALRHPLSFRQRVRRQLRRVQVKLGRYVRNRDFADMRVLVGYYTGPVEVDRVFYINLDSSPDRRADMDRILTRVDAPFERFRGINGAQERATYQAYLDQRPPLPPSRRPAGGFIPYDVTDGIVGCWLSHVHLLKHIATLDEGLYIVLEDDFRLPSAWREEIRALLAEIPDDWDLLKLYSDAIGGKPRLRGARVSESLVRLGPALLTQQNLSSAAYIVRHEGGHLQRIIDALEGAPVMHYDDALNYLMDQLIIYAPRKQFGKLTPAGVFSTRVGVP